MKQVWGEYHKFPAITVCPHYFYSKSLLNEKYPGLIDVINFDPLTFDFAEIVQSCLGQETDPSENNESLLYSITLEELFLETMVPIDEFFISCTWNSDILLNCSELFEKVYTNNGFCYSFYRHFDNSATDDFVLSQSGLDFSLTLAIDIHQEQYTVGVTSEGAGVTFITHEHNTIPHARQNTVSLAPGFEHNVAISKFVTKRLPPPYTDIDCVDEKEAASYSRDACLKECQSRDTYRDCDCRVADNRYEECTVCDQFTCIRKDLPTYHNGKCKCKPSCKETFFQSKVSSLLYPSDGLIPLMVTRIPNRYTIEDIRNNVLKLKVYFERMDYTLSQEKPSITAWQLVCDLGGSLGLCLGASLITVVEFGEMFVITISKYLSKKSKQGKMKQKTYPLSNT